ncbi:arginase family protein [Amycolatopsis sp. YIM 10]|uniref:arginase family protein n=1 Tax=Amycolatopsis sp. YIM 10 TaxID=2653857 RepID=UPI0012905C1F|nr:arginase family protein [Amycolatopsis sp. YIM 10]QFU92745.1 Arginase [Amycolatopsis sp. YIM 10]
MRVIGAPFSSAGRMDHEALAPEALREAGLIERLRAALGPDEPVTSGGDVAIGASAARPHRDGHSGLRSLPGLEAVTTTMRAAVAETLLDYDRPLVLGGDCAILPGCLRGAQDALGYDQVGLLFIDGHEDAWPPHESDTGEAADSELGFLLGQHREQLPASLDAQLPVLDRSAVVALGPRDGDEIAASDAPSLAEQVRLVTAQQLTVGEDSPADHARKALARIRANTAHWWLHIDLDVLSSDALDAVSYEQPGGLDWNQLSELVATALSEPGCVGITVCDYDPDRDPDGTGARRVLDWFGSLPTGVPPTSSLLTPSDRSALEAAIWANMTPCATTTTAP